MHVRCSKQNANWQITDHKFLLIYWHTKVIYRKNIIHLLCCGITHNSPYWSWLNYKQSKRSDIFSMHSLPIKGKDQNAIIFKLAFNYIVVMYKLPKIWVIFKTWRMGGKHKIGYIGFIWKLLQTVPSSVYYLSY